MAWREESIVEQRLEFVTLARVEGANIAELCRRFQVSRQTGYRWLARHVQGDRSTLEDRSSRPASSPRKTSDEIENAVVALRDKHPAWGGRKLRVRLLALGHEDVPAPSTITEVLRRHGRLGAAGVPVSRPHRRFERARPNELWQMDFKGHVPMHVGGRCHPLTILDDHSRFAIGLRACVNEREEVVREELIRVFRVYGLPERILCDNGPPWGVPRGRDRHTRLSAWLLRLGVGVTHGRPRHPQTQGKDERFHRTLKAELLSRQELRNIREAQQAFNLWRDVYNIERPSEAIGLCVPASRYTPSERTYPEKPPKLEFSPLDEVRKVKHDGSFGFLGRAWYVGEAFAHEHVGVRHTHNGVLEARYGPSIVGRFDLAACDETR